MKLLSGPISDLEAGLRFHATRQAALASNVANADTPGYRRVDVSFEGALAAASEMQRTRSGHLQGSSPSGMKIERGPLNPQSPDGNGVERDREIIRLSRNASAFGDQAQVLARLMAMRRVAATGQL